MNIIFWDTETNGLPKNYKAPMQAVSNWPRIIQLAWEVVDSETQEVKEAVKILIKPDGWNIPQEKFWIDNGYSTETNDEYGTPMPEVLDLFIDSLNTCDLMVAHNIAFDHPITGAEFIRYNRVAGKPSNPRTKICTMQASTNLCKIPGQYGFKWPRLEELHQFLFKKGFDGAHDAGNDVAACRACFFELVRRDVIKLPIIKGDE